MEAKKTYKEGQLQAMWMSYGMIIGVAIITPFAIAFDMIAFIGMGPAFGVAIGLPIGAGLEVKYKKEGRIVAYTEEETEANKKKVKKALFLVLGVVVLLAIGLVLVVSYLKK